jgi:hypothetical protein
MSTDISNEFGVLYFHHGTKHSARLVASLYSLRSVYDGPVTILDTGESGGIIEKIAADDRLAATVTGIRIKKLKRHTSYVAKAGLWRESPYDCSLLLDCDTLVVKPIDQLRAIICDRSNPGFVVTRFSDWVTQGNIISGRLKQWKEISVRGLDVADALKRSLREVHPAINTGVVGFRKDTEDVLRAWEKLTTAGAECSFSDELAAQIVIRLFKHTLVADYFNHSVLYGTQPKKAVIIHAHGGKHLRPEMGGRWLSVYQHCIAENVGGIADWTPAGDPVLATHLQSLREKSA